MTPLIHRHARSTVDHQRHLAKRTDGADAVFVQPPAMALLQMQVSDRHRHRIHPGFGGKPRGLCRVGAAGPRPTGITDKADLALARRACGMRHGRSLCRYRDVLVQRQMRSVVHHRGKSTVQRLTAFLQALTMIQMRHHRNTRRLCQRPEHRRQHRQRRMCACARPGLQDHRHAFGFGGSDIGARVFPAQHHKARDGMPPHQRRAKHVGQRGKRHLNFAIMSLMPGIVSI